ncbi:TlpA disulfide reductase family protein [Cytobacillus gottheilii]|uniref:TlpA disulfide reductase family protein n=1 Tax=Cytobacillus gottheilii TaxID=859144 RepID=UPI0009BB8E32|nr:TlpA disulfide reductase family protein [Cytobacillus gottheilii]
MKKLVIIVIAVLAVMFVIDVTILKDKGIIPISFGVEKYEKIENVNDLKIGLEAGDLAPEIELVDMEGNVQKLSELRGQKVLLNFWASWCGPCEIEMPHMEKLYQKYKDEGFTVFAVNMSQSERNDDDAEKFVKKHKLTFPIPMDRDGVVSRDYDVVGYPTSYFIDSDGVIRHIVLGTLDEEYLENQILKLP